jgi:hypothetical protein
VNLVRYLADILYRVGDNEWGERGTLHAPEFDVRSPFNWQEMGELVAIYPVYVVKLKNVKNRRLNGWWARLSQRNFFDRSGDGHATHLVHQGPSGPAIVYPCQQC